MQDKVFDKPKKKKKWLQILRGEKENERWKPISEALIYKPFVASEKNINIIISNFQFSIDAMNLRCALQYAFHFWNFPV